MIHRLLDFLDEFAPGRVPLLLIILSLVSGAAVALRVLADRPRRAARFLVLGSASPDLLRQTSESLAGRIAYYELPGLSLAEVGSDRGARLWLRGGFPRSFTARSGTASSQWPPRWPGA